MSSLWERISRAGRDALNEMQGSDECKQLGPHGVQVAAARSTQLMVKTLCAHVEDLEARLAEQGTLYKGIWQQGRMYPVGSFVTHGGSMWHADKETSFKPGEGGGWTLAVKRGADAR